MESLPCKGCKGLCCGPVAITAKEFEKIKRKVKSMPVKIRQSLRSQQRFPGTCIFYDLEKDKCGIYSARPEVCRAFGYHKNLACFRDPKLAESNPDFTPEEPPIGILSVNFTWEDFK